MTHLLQFTVNESKDEDRLATTAVCLDFSFSDGSEGSRPWVRYDFSEVQVLQVPPGELDIEQKPVFALNYNGVYGGDCISTVNGPRFDCGMCDGYQSQNFLASELCDTTFNCDQPSRVTLLGMTDGYPKQVGDGPFVKGSTWEFRLLVDRLEPRYD